MHPPLFPFLSKERWESFLKHSLQISDGHLEVAGKLLQKGVIPIFHGPELGHFLGVSPKIVSLMAARPDRFYNSFKIQKKGGGSRTINAPRVFLKQTQRYILDCILNQIELQGSVVGFRKGFSLVNSAKPHLTNRFLWNIDIKNFFPSISKRLVIEEFKKIGYPQHSANFLTNLCTLQDQLPQGAPTSPALANLVFGSLDSQIGAMCEDIGVTYTRYADDLSFSSPILIPPKFRREIKTLISKEEFKLNTKKERLIGPAGRREVTGIVINEQLSIPRKTRRRIRAMFHQAKGDPDSHAGSRSQLAGYVGWVSIFHPDEAAEYRDILASIPVISS